MREKVSFKSVNKVVTDPMAHFKVNGEKVLFPGFKRAGKPGSRSVNLPTSQIMFFRP